MIVVSCRWSLKLQREGAAMWDHAYGREARCDWGAKIRWSHRGLYTRASADMRAAQEQTGFDVFTIPASLRLLEEVTKGKGFYRSWRCNGPEPYW